MWKRSQSKYIHDNPVIKRETGYLLTLPTKWRPRWMGHHPSKMTDVENTCTGLPWLTDNPLCLGRTQFLREGVLGGSLFQQVKKSRACSRILDKPIIKHFWSWSKKKVLHIKQSFGSLYPLKRLWNHSLIFVLDCGIFLQAVIHTYNLAKPLGLLLSTCIHVSTFCVVLPGMT